MQYMGIREFAEKTGWSHEGIRRLLLAGRVPGAQRVGTVWAIPADFQPVRQRAAFKKGLGRYQSRAR